MTRQARRNKSRRLNQGRALRYAWRNTATASYPGIDYSRGLSNRDLDTGIHFGVISMNDLNEWAWESFEADYGEPACPKCGNAAVEPDEAPDDDYEEGFKSYRKAGCVGDYYCLDCKIYFDGEDAYGEEPVGNVLDDAEYKGCLDSCNDVFLVKSPYYTYARFCSPCAPGAGHLGSPCPGGVKTYCFGHDWFDGNVAPYPVFSVATERLVRP